MQMRSYWVGGGPSTQRECPYKRQRRTHSTPQGSGGGCCEVTEADLNGVSTPKEERRAPPLEPWEAARPAHTPDAGFWLPEL